MFRSGAAGAFGERAKEFLDRYPAATDNEARMSFAEFYTDVFAMEMRSWARVAQGTGRRSVYLYRFNRIAPDVQCRCAFHGAELPYVFSNVASSSRPYGDVDRRLSELMSSYWVNFAKTGNPNGAALPSWMAYTPQEDAFLELSDKIEKQQVPKAPLDFVERLFEG